MEHIFCYACRDITIEDKLVGCSTCGRHFCVFCATDDGHLDDDDEYSLKGKGLVNEHGQMDSQYCPYCHGKAVDDGDLITFICEIAGLDGSIMKEKFKEEIKSGNVKLTTGFDIAIKDMPKIETPLNKEVLTVVAMQADRIKELEKELENR